MARVTRHDILELFKELPRGYKATTSEIAMQLKVREYQVRAGVAWLVMGCILCECGAETRRDRQDRKYKAKLYRWTGQTDIDRVPRDPTDRRIVMERKNHKQFAAMLKKAW